MYFDSVMHSPSFLAYTTNSVEIVHERPENLPGTECLEFHQISCDYQPAVQTIYHSTSTVIFSSDFWVLILKLGFLRGRLVVLLHVSLGVVSS